MAVLVSLAVRDAGKCLAVMMWPLGEKNDTGNNWPWLAQVTCELFGASRLNVDCFMCIRLASQRTTNSGSTRDTRPHSREAVTLFPRDTACFKLSHDALGPPHNGRRVAAAGCTPKPHFSLSPVCDRAWARYHHQRGATSPAVLHACVDKGLERGVGLRTLLSTLFHHFAVTVSAER